MNNETNTATLEQLAIRFRVTGLAYREALLSGDRDYVKFNRLFEEAYQAEFRLTREIDRLIDAGAPLSAGKERS